MSPFSQGHWELIPPTHSHLLKDLQSWAPESMDYWTMGHYAGHSLEFSGLHLPRLLLPDFLTGVFTASHVLLGVWRKKPISEHAEAATPLAWMVVRQNMMAGYLPSLNLPATIQNQSRSGANAPVASRCLRTCKEIPTALPYRSQYLNQHSIHTWRTGALL